MTGAYSRNSFDDSIKDIIGTGDSYLCFFDVDRFKFVNDNFGHLFGDEVLIYVVHYLKDKMNGFNFRIYRFGGDEFAGNDSNLLIVFYVQIMPDDLVMQLHRF